MNIFWLLLGNGPFFGWWWVVLDMFWLVVGGGWWWMVVNVFRLEVDSGIVWSNPFIFNFDNTWMFLEFFNDLSQYFLG